MDARARRLVRQRAEKICEYCHFPDYADNIPFHVEHIVASSHQRNDALENLAWSCSACNLHKGPNLATIDPDTGLQIDLFNPRHQEWGEHFTIRDAIVVGLTSSGRGTARLLNMNELHRVAFRRELIASDEL